MPCFPPFDNDLECYLSPLSPSTNLPLDTTGDLPRLQTALALVKEELRPILGQGEAFSMKHEWRYRTPIGPWILETYIDVGGSVHQPAYSDNIRTRPPRPFKDGLSLLGWLGFGGGHTTWSQLTAPDVAAAAKALMRICAHFMNAAPALVSGLSPE